jgi:hypothetical protein
MRRELQLAGHDAIHIAAQQAFVEDGVHNRGDEARREQPVRERHSRFLGITLHAKTKKNIYKWQTSFLFSLKKTSFVLHNQAMQDVHIQ